MISLSDHVNKDGSIDWTSYRQARVAAGEICHRCGGTADLLGLNPGIQLCPGCKRMDESNDEVYHGSRIRCPRCGAITAAEDHDYLEEGENYIVCDVCELEFEVTVVVSYQYVSPEMLREEDRDAD